MKWLELTVYTTDGRAAVISTAQLLPKTTRNTIGVSVITLKKKAALSYAVQYAYYAAQNYYTTILEMDTGKGYADIVYLPSPKYPDKPALLIELKYNKTADTAMDQIKRQQYPERIEHYKGNILLVAINYEKDTPAGDPDFKHHQCVIERA